MEKSYCIYKHTNMVNGKIYIGQTSQIPERRWQNGLSTYKNNSHFINAIKKYGWENFKHEIILDNLNEEEMKYWEAYYIDFYDTRNPNKGYNILKGGQKSPFETLWENPEFREKMSKQQSEIMKERLKDPKEREKLRQIALKNWEEHPERKKEYAERMSSTAKELWQNEDFRNKQIELTKQRWQNEEYKEKMSKISKEKALKQWQNKEYRKKMCKAVINIETGLQFESGAAASRWCGVDRSTITKALKTGRQGGKHPETKEPLHWRYATEGGEG